MRFKFPFLDLDFDDLTDDDSDKQPGLAVIFVENTITPGGGRSVHKRKVMVLNNKDLIDVLKKEIVRLENERS